MIPIYTSGQYSFRQVVMDECVKSAHVLRKEGTNITPSTKYYKERLERKPHNESLVGEVLTGKKGSGK